MKHLTNIKRWLSKLLISKPGLRIEYIVDKELFHPSEDDEILYAEKASYIELECFDKRWQG